MHLYLMQHGQALSEAEDPERPLSQAGDARVHASAAGIVALELGFDAIVASPKQRSRQTADIIARVVGYPVKDILETESVKPSSAPEAIAEYLASMQGKTSVLIAGHLPSLSKFASYFLCGHTAPSLHFQHGGLCCIAAETLEVGAGELAFYLAPPHLAAIAQEQADA